MNFYTLMKHSCLSFLSSVDKLSKVAVPVWSDWMIAAKRYFFENSKRVNLGTSIL